MSVAHDPFRGSRARTRLAEREQLDGRRPRVLAVAHLYVPQHNAGAELMLHTMLRALVADGWDAHVALTDYRGQPYTRDGVSVAQIGTDGDLGRSFEWCDVAVTHLDGTRRAIAWSRWGRPLVHVVHNHRQLFHHNVRPSQAQLVVWNSEWVKAAHQWRGEPTMIVRPPVTSSEYRVEHDRGGALTLLNLYPAKGSGLFWQLAERMPDRRFLGVRGAYGGQNVPKIVPSNVTVVENTPNVHRIYQQTGVLLVPSSYESWGRVAVEAMASGIPVVANPTPGLREALTSSPCGPAALFVDHEDIDGWHDALRSLERPDVYDAWSARARARSAELDDVAVADLAAFCVEMRRLAQPTAQRRGRLRSGAMTTARSHDPFSPHDGTATRRPRRSPSPVTRVPDNIVSRLRNVGVDDVGVDWLQRRFEAATDDERASALHDLHVATVGQMQEFADVITQYVAWLPLVRILVDAGLDEAEAEDRVTELYQSAKDRAALDGTDADETMTATRAALLGEESTLSPYAVVDDGPDLVLRRFDSIASALAGLADDDEPETEVEPSSEEAPTEARALVEWIGSDGRRAMSALLAEVQRQKMRPSVRQAIEAVLGEAMVARSIEQAGG